MTQALTPVEIACPIGAFGTRVCGGFTQVFGGTGHAVAQVGTEIATWGRGNRGQLGHGDLQQRETPGFPLA